MILKDFLHSFWQQPLETKNLLDKLRQPPYCSIKGIYDSKLVFDLRRFNNKNSVKNSEYLLADYIKL
ncbi:hypothetical protein EUZ93_02345 [Wolbachia pipientis]|nr:hypothetical protein [Wolbachia pipientis]